MASKATMDMMDELHRLTTAELADIIKNGIPVFNKETGEEVARERAPASYVSAAIKFLKDNDVTADPAGDRFDALKEATRDLPDFGDDGVDTYYN